MHTMLVCNILVNVIEEKQGRSSHINTANTTTCTEACSLSLHHEENTSEAQRVNERLKQLWTCTDVAIQGW